jgi:hypothetical protein
MKKVILILCVTFAFSQTLTAQKDFGIKGGVNYNNNGDVTTFSSTGDDVIQGAESKSGFHAGLWFRGKVPIIGLYIRPELVYTQVRSEYRDSESNSSNYEFSKIDVPVLFGKNFLGLATAFVGPSFQYILNDDFEFSEVTTTDFDKFSVGLQMGLGIEFGNLGIDVRWERGLSETEANFYEENADADFTIDNRTNQIIFSLSYQL